MPCTICRKPSRPRARYCPRCRRFIFHKPEHEARAKAMRLSWSPERDRFLCHYTGVELDETGPRTRWYLTFDHVVPGKKGELVACATLINEMKSDLSEEEFWAVVREFARYKATGTFRRSAVKFEHWYRLVPPSRLGTGELPAPRGTAVTACAVCGRDSLPGSTYCKRCRRFVFPKYERKARREALSGAWSEREDGFLCHYTGVKLDEDEVRSPWYLSFDHAVPGEKGNLVVSARFMNTFKVDLDEGEFMRVMGELAGRMEGEEFDRGVIKRNGFRRH